jgi:transcriptional regulator with XRE-family HTH domain
MARLSLAMERGLRADVLLTENIRALLHSRHEDAKSLARWCGHSGPWMSKILSGERGVQVEELGRIADFFGLTVSELFQHGISKIAERRSAERRSGSDRRSAADRRDPERSFHPTLKMRMTEKPPR